MEETIIDTKIDELKPVMKTLPSFTALTCIPGQTIVQVKVDGEFTMLSYSRDKSFTLNRWGKERKDFPALNEFQETMRKTPLGKAEFLCELYGMEGDTPLKLPDYIHYIKSGNPELVKKINIGVFDLLSINGVPIQQNYAWKMEEVNSWIQSCKLCRILPFIKPEATPDVEKFWNEWVLGKGYEGLVARSNGDTFKIKPISEVDAVIIGINKRELFFSKQVTSIRLAVMTEDGHFVEMGDCASGITHDLRTLLWGLMDFKVGEDDKTVWVKPIAICTVQYTDLFKGRNTEFLFDEKSGYTQYGTRAFVRLKSPRLIRFRSDKRVTPADLRLEQIPLEFWKDIWNLSDILGKA